jgi:multiple sugar transport system ATP-binding protein
LFSKDKRGAENTTILKMQPEKLTRQSPDQSPESTSVRLHGVSKNYGKVKALVDVTFDVGYGELFTLVGPTGAGKTTTLKVIAGLEDPSAGDVYLAGKSAKHIGAWERDVSMTFEGYGLYPHLSVFDNIASPLRAPIRNKEFTSAQIREQVTRVAEMLGIGGLLDRRPAHLSGGQRQRVALSRSLVRHAGVYLLDEPLAHLDAKLRHRTRSELKRMMSTLGAAVIYVTHDYKEALALSDRVAVLHNGKLQQVATPEEIFTHPANLFVADFIGDPPMNLIAGELAAKGGSLYLQSASFELRMPPKLSEKIMRLNGRAREVVLGIRPMHVAPGTGQSDSVLQGEVFAIEPRAEGNSLLIVKVGQELVHSVVPLRYQAEIGQSISLELETEWINLFSKETGVNLQ